MARQNWLAQKLLEQAAKGKVDLGALRAARRIDPNNEEYKINRLTGGVTSHASQRLAVAKGLGLNTQGLIIGGQRDTAPRTGSRPFADQTAHRAGERPIHEDKPGGQDPNDIKPGGRAVPKPDKRSGRPGGF